MKCILLTTLLATLAVSSLAAPFDLSDIFSSFQPLEKQDVVKRQVQVQANPDAELKQISFHGLIGDLEDSLFQSALSLHQASAPGSEVQEVKPGQAVDEDEEHALTKRSDESTPATTETEGSTDDGLARKILVQTTKKVPGSEDGGVPAHLIIDHVSVQPHNGGALPLIPTFQVHHTKLISATIKEDSNNDSSDGKQTKISITKTSITSTAPLESVEEAVAAAAAVSSSSSSSSPSSTTESATTKAAQEKEQTEAEKPSSTTVLTIVTSSSSDSSSSSSSTSTTTTTTTTTTTEAPIEKLKKDEEKLKEKVAEVEADPVILSARV